MIHVTRYLYPKSEKKIIKFRIKLIDITNKLVYNIYNKIYYYYKQTKFTAKISSSHGTVNQC